MKRYPVKFNVSDVNGTNGFSFIDDLDVMGFGEIVSNLGDINADGKSDFMVSSSIESSIRIIWSAKLPW